MRSTKQLDWDSVKLLVLMDMDGSKKLARVFDNHNNEFWLVPGAEPRYVGMNEPPEFGIHKQLSGDEAKACVIDFLAG